MKCGNPVCFVYGELKLFLKGGEYNFFFFFYVSNLGGKSEFTFVFILSFILFWFTCIFHTCIYGLFSVSGIYKLIHLKLLSILAIDSS